MTTATASTTPAARRRTAYSRVVRALRGQQNKYAKRLRDDLFAYFLRLSRRVSARLTSGMSAAKQEFPPHAEWITPEDEAELERILRRYASLMIIESVRLLGGATLGDDSALPDFRLARLLTEWHGRADAVTAQTRSIITDTLTAAGLRGYSLFQIVNGVERDDFPGLRAALGGAYRGRAETIARTEMAYAAQAGAHERYEERGVRHVEIIDGPGCGWTSHDDPDKADGSIRTISEARMHPLSHPNCRRVSVPVLTTVP